VACMIQSRITSKAQTTVPQAVRRALGVGPGDEIAWEIEEDRVVLRRAKPSLDPFDNPFATFTEWSDELDSVYDNL
jgi:antitoxin PrlF